MKAIRYLFPLVALLCLAEVALPDAAAQQTEELRKEFQSTKAKAEKGDASAQYNLGLMYANGEGVEKDYAEAVKWYRKAAEQGNAIAQSNLGWMYQYAKGVEKDFVEAYAWYNIAAKNWSPAAEVRDNLEKEMSPQQVGEAQKRTRELKVLIEAKKK